ncbi:unnamed protein product [Microthlaspi erraticum]|uniref:Uncharacterized protein n=1 Tax=Microthlaspi erraticum TaxID=1685480 RepID=A0A6D2J345_9BRAS|nr:unnamed protein product [Microthlaspi erraticum]
MSRKGVIAKRVKTAPDGHIENQRPTRSPAGRGTNVPRSAKTVSVRLKSRPKSKTVGRSRNHDPGNIARGRPSHATTAHDQTARAGKRLAAAQLISRTTHDAPSEPGNYVPRPAEKHRPNFIRPTTPADRIIRPDRSDSAKTRLSGRSSRPTVRTPRSTRSRF